MRALVIALLAACNPVFDLEPTGIAPQDRDRDGIDDDEDNCIDVANPDQAESDGDALGDACDGCAGVLADTNHDEDFDGRPDACDVCPAQDDFGTDRDDDGVGDACDFDNGRMSSRSVFDAFESLDAWDTTTGWRAHDDTAAPDEALAATDIGIRLPHEIDATYFTVSTVLVSREHWPVGTRAGVVLEPPGGGPIISCLLECTEVACVLALVVDDVKQNEVVVQPNPFALMGMSSNLIDPVTRVRDYYCAAPALGRNAIMSARPPASTATSWTPRLVASPVLRAAYFEVVE